MTWIKYPNKWLLSLAEFYAYHKVWWLPIISEVQQVSKMRTVSGAIRLLLRLFIIVLASTVLLGRTAQANEEMQFPSAAEALHFFSDCGLLIDRGLTNSPLAGRAEECILEALVKNKQLQKFVAITQIQITELSQMENVQIPSSSRESSNDTSVAFLEDEFALQFREQLKNTLDEKQLNKIVVCYLAFEGLASLRRNELTELLQLSDIQRRKIVNLIEESPAKELHSSIFRLQNEELDSLPSLNLRLRQVSSALDHKIVDLLSANQQKQLVPVVAETAIVVDLIPRPGIGRPWLVDFRIEENMR